MRRMLRSVTFVSGRYEVCIVNKRWLCLPDETTYVRDGGFWGYLVGDGCPKPFVQDYLDAVVRAYDIGKRTAGAPDA